MGAGRRLSPTREQGAGFRETLYLRPHRIRYGLQTITVTVLKQPSDAGIDPYVVLIDLERFDNRREGGDRAVRAGRIRG